MRHKRILIIVALAAFVIALSIGCKKKDDGILLPRGIPRISNINSAGDPKSPVGVAIEVNGKNFGFNPGEVRFEQGANVANVVPDAAGWSGTSIVVIVPDTGSGGAFTVPGTVTVYGQISSIGIDRGRSIINNSKGSRRSTGITTLICRGKGHGS